MGKYTQQDEDSNRLPEGIKRVGYDTDTSRYTFKDRKGTLYIGESGSEYGQLKPVLDPTAKVERERPEAFNDSEGKDRYIPHSPRLSDEAAPRSFHDMLPAQLITSPTTQPDAPQSSSAFAGFAALVSPTSARNTDSLGGLTSPTLGSAIPKVQGLVQSLKRSMSSATKKKKGGVDGRNRAMSTSDSKRSMDGGSTHTESEKQRLARKYSQESFNSMEKK